MALKVVYKLRETVFILKPKFLTNV